MVLVCDTYHGNTDETVPEGDVEQVILSRGEARRSRVRAETETGREVGIVVDRRLCDGDTVYDDGEIAVVVSLGAVEAFAVELDGLSPVEAAEFGHELGNAHGEMAVEDGTAYVPVGDARTLVNRLDGARVERVEVEPSVFDREDDGAIGDSHHGDGGHEHGHGHDHHGDDSTEHRHEHIHHED